MKEDSPDYENRTDEALMRLALDVEFAWGSYVSRATDQESDQGIRGQGSESSISSQSGVQQEALGNETWLVVCRGLRDLLTFFPCLDRLQQ